MAAPLTLERIAEINSAISEYNAAKTALSDAGKLVALKDRQFINVGKPHYDKRFYPEQIEVPMPVIRSLIAERVKAAEAWLSAAKRALAQLNVETPA